MAQLVLVGDDRYVTNSLYLYLVLLFKSFVSFLVYISSPQAIFFFINFPFHLSVSVLVWNDDKLSHNVLLFSLLPCSNFFIFIFVA